MDSLVSISAVLVCFALAVNIGGNNSAAEMAPAYGAAIRTKKESLILIAIFSFIGAMVAGKNVVQTVASGLVTTGSVSNAAAAAVIVLGSAMTMIAIANYLKLPIATSHATVGAIIGLGLIKGHVHWATVTEVIIWWIVTPIAAFGASYAIGRSLGPLSSWLNRWTAIPHAGALCRLYVTASGCYLAFSAGSNGLAKAIGPLVGSGRLPYEQTALLGAVGLALGAILIGPGVLETVGKQITPISPLQAVFVELICGSIMLGASVAGMPISLAEVVTSSVIGLSAAGQGLATTWQNRHVNRIIKLWLVCPFSAALCAFGMASIFL